MDDLARLRDQTSELTVAQLFGVGDVQDCFKVLAHGIGTTIPEREEDAVLSMADALFNDHLVSFSLYSCGRSVWPAEEPSVTGTVVDQDRMIFYFDSHVMMITHRESEFVNVGIDVSIENYLERELLRRFVPIEEVDAIYTGRYLDECRITVLLSSEVYDDALMDRLLESEYEIHNTFPHPVLSFTYVPFLGRERGNFVHLSSRLIFNR